MGLFGFGNKYPYTDFHELNLDWILSVIRSLQSEMQTFVNVNTIKYADPILWDISSQYEQNTLVQDSDGITYLSKTAVPAGISINNTDYWLKVADFSSLADIIKRSITSADDGASPTSTDNRTEGDLVWLNNYLYEVLRTINIGDAYVEGGVNPNVEKVTIEDLLDDLLALINANNIKPSITASDDNDSATSTANRTVGDLVWLNNILYEVIAPITAGDSYIIGTNITAVTIEMLLKNLSTDISTVDGKVDQEILDRAAADVTINARIDALQFGSIFYNVKQYGAVGDGVTDDAASIQDAIDAAYNAGGGTVYFPDGTYKVDSSIIGKSNVSMLGENGAIIDVTNVPAETDLNYGHHIGIYYKGSKNKIGEVTGNINVGEYQFSIDNPSALNVGDFIELVSTTIIVPYQSAAVGPYKGEIYEVIDITGNVVTVDHGSNFVFTTAEGVDVYKITPCENFNIENICVVSNGGAAAQIDGIYLWLCHNAVIDKCKILGCDWYSIGIVESFNIDISENFIKGVWYDGNVGSIFYGIAVLNASQWINIVNNQAEVVRHLYVNTSYFNTQICAGVPRFINVIGNIAKNMMFGGNGVSYAYQHHGTGSEINFIGNIADSCYAGISVEGENVNIVGNVIKNARYHGILIGNGLYVDHINVQSNHIYPLLTNSITSPDGEPCGAITLNNRNSSYTIKDVTISGNTIEHNGTYAHGINIGSVGTYEDIDISNNNIVATNTAANLPSIRGAGTNVSIRDNNIKSQYGIVAGSANVTVKGNRIDPVQAAGTYMGIDAGWAKCKIVDNLISGIDIGIYVDTSCPCLNNTLINCTTPISGSPTTDVNNNSVSI